MCWVKNASGYQSRDGYLFCAHIYSHKCTPGIDSLRWHRPASLGANVRAIPGSPLWYNVWSRLAGESRMNRGICFGEHLPLLRQVSELSEWYLLIPSKPGYLCLPGGEGYLALPYWQSRDTDPMCYSRGFTHGDIGYMEKQAGIGYQHQRISSVKDSDSEIHV